MFGKLVKLANRFDKNGLPQMADKVDKLILALAQEIGGNINLVELMRLKPEVIMSLGKAISFDLVMEPDPDGRGNSVRAIPKIHDKWTDGLNLGDISNLTELQGHMMPAAVDETMKKIEEGGWFEEDADLPTLSEDEFDFAPEYVAEEKEKEERGRKELDEALSGAYEAVEKEQLLPGTERSPEVKRKEVSDAAGGAHDAVEQMWPEEKSPLFTPEDFKPAEEGKVAGNKTLQERNRMRDLTEAEVRAALVKMADEFDQSGQHDLAAEIDTTLKSFSARPKAPLKKLDDKVKKNLIVFVHDADQNNAKSIKGLNELFRRLRYFNFSDSAKDLGLERVVKDMEKTQEGLEVAKKRFFELMHGKKPSKKDLDEMFDEIVEEAQKDDGQNTLDFFGANSDDEFSEFNTEDQADEDFDPTPEKDLIGMDEEEELLGSFEVGPEGVKDLDEEEEISEEMEEELEKFLEGLEDQGGEE